MAAAEGVSVTGTVGEDDEGKKTLTASKIEMPEEDAEG